MLINNWRVHQMSYLSFWLAGFVTHDETVITNEGLAITHNVHSNLEEPY